MTQERWSDAAEEANTVITSEAFALVKNYIDEFPAPDPARPIVNSTEDIFAAQITDQQGFNALNEVYATSDFSGRGEITINQSFIAKYEEIDDRLKVFTISYDDDGEFEEAFCDKYNNQYGNVKTIRLAEMYLIRAEANFRNGSQLGATPLDDVNILRERANATLLATVDLNAILNERVLELAFEGQSLPDLKRTKGSIGGGIQWNSSKLVFPIPQREMDANPALKGQQNEGYGN
ncbi:SusD family protein [compost metagenome]